jgi:hypothetical protein
MFDAALYIWFGSFGGLSKTKQGSIASFPLRKKLQSQQMTFPGRLQGRTFLVVRRGSTNVTAASRDAKLTQAVLLAFLLSSPNPSCKVVQRSRLPCGTTIGT